MSTHYKQAGTDVKSNSTQNGIFRVDKKTGRLSAQVTNFSVRVVSKVVVPTNDTTNAMAFGGFGLWLYFKARSTTPPDPQSKVMIQLNYKQMKPGNIVAALRSKVRNHLIIFDMPPIAFGKFLMDDSASRPLYTQTLSPRIDLLLQHCSCQAYKSTFI